MSGLRKKIRYWETSLSSTI